MIKAASCTMDCIERLQKRKTTKLRLEIGWTIYIVIKLFMGLPLFWLAN